MLFEVELFSLMFVLLVFKFELDSFKKKCLLEGLDDIALSLEKTKNIESFENKMSQSRPWL